MKDTMLYIYGGFENSNPNFPVEKLLKIDVMQYFSSNQNICLKIEEEMSSSKESNSTDKKLSSLSSVKDKENLSTNSNILMRNNNISQIDSNTKQDQKFRLASQAVVVKFGENSYDDIGLIRKVSIDKLNDEAKRIGYHNIRSQINPRRVYNEDLINKFIDTLLRPFDWYTNEVDEIHKNLPFTLEEIDSLN
jgi:molybdopterin converting factor small subunit